MIDSGGLSGTLRGKPIIAVIVCERELAGNTVELRRECPVCAAHSTVVSKENGIKADPRERRTLVFPCGSARRDRVVEGDAQSVISRSNKSFAGRPVNANGGLTRTMLACGG